MFQLAEIRRMVRVPPHLFGGTLDSAVSEELNRKLANKVVLDVGLCIALYDIVSLGDSYIFPGDGASHTRVTFRYIVFRPLMEEVLEGIIKASDSEGIQVTLGFFEDIYIRKDSMMSNSRYDETEKSWVWDYQTTDTCHPLYMDVGEMIRFKVIEEQFTDTTPNTPNDEEGKATTEKKNVAPYIVYGAINDHGLGMISWWINQDAEEEAEDVNDEDQSDEAAPEES